MIKRELLIFLIVGLLTVLVDFVSYHGLVGSALIPVNAAKAAAFLAGSLFAYFANRFWTFGHVAQRTGNAWRFAVLYGATLSSNVLVNALVLTMLVGVEGSIQLAFLAATSVSACLNFLGMKLFVFKANSPEWGV
jgi:putative flippase GtrA